MDDSIQFIKSFSRGQITIPKAMRKALGLNGNFWLKVYLEKGKIIAEPVETEETMPSQEEYLQKLMKIKGDWFDEKEFQETRKEMDKRIDKLWKKKR